MPRGRSDDDRVGLGALFLVTVVLVGTLLAWPAGTRSLLLVTTACAAMIMSIAWNVGAGSGPRRRDLAAIAAAAIGIGSVLLAADSSIARAAASGAVVVVGFTAPVAVFRGLRRRRRMDLAVLFGAISIYLLVGVAFAMAYSTLAFTRGGELLSLPDGPGAGTLQDRVYFSFITLSTTGYGDITPLDPLARALAVLEAIGGQLYLVVALTSVVSVLLSRREAQGTLPPSTGDPAEPA